MRPKRHLARAAEISRRAGDERRYAIASAFLGHAARGRGEYQLAAERYRTAQQTFERLGSHRGTAWAEHDLGLLACETGDYASAETDLREALRHFRELDYPWGIASSACGLATVLVAVQRLDETAQLLSDALVRYDSLADRRGVAQCLESLAALAVARGEAGTAGRLLGAAQAWRTMAAARPSRTEQERLVVLDRSVVGALGREAADAERHAGRSLRPGASIALAAAFAVDATDPAKGDASELTTRQRDVAALVAAGRTNRQIGRALGISEKTAEVHIRNIMVRLNTPSRAGVAAWAAAQRLTPPQG
jgi:non-specific serine/threonine protein kinase